jgi:hypothetical protein
MVESRRWEDFPGPSLKGVFDESAPDLMFHTFGDVVARVVQND